MALGATIRLSFSQNGKPSLERVVFRYDEELGDIVSSRGRSQTGVQLSNSFLWSPAVRALCVLFLRTKYLAQDEATLAGDAASLASSLDYALGKNTTWLSDMFGYDTDGQPYSKKLLLRSNPERKRPGPVVISINPQILKPSDISLIVDGVVVSNPKDIQNLADMIEQHTALRKGGPGEFKLKTTLDETSLAIEQSSQFNTRKDIHVYTTPLNIEKKFIECLHRRSIDRKFGFWGEQGPVAWESLCRSNQYYHFKDDLQLITESLPQILECISSPCQVVAVWPGTAEKEMRLYDAIRDKTSATLSMVDLSQDMLTYLLRRYQQRSSEIECYIADFMEPGLLCNICERIRQNDQPNILTFFGNTMGEHPQSEFLQSVRSALKPQDLVLFGIQSSPESEMNAESEMQRLSELYANPHFSKLDLSNLKKCGIEIGDGVVEIETCKDRFIPELWVVEVYFRFTCSKVISYSGEDIYFSEGERLILNFYYQYSHSVAVKIICGQGFEILKTFISNQGAIEFLCRIK